MHSKKTTNWQAINGTKQKRHARDAAAKQTQMSGVMDSRGPTGKNSYNYSKSRNTQRVTSGNSKWCKNNKQIMVPEYQAKTKKTKKQRNIQKEKAPNPKMQAKRTASDNRIWNTRKTRRRRPKCPKTTTGQHVVRAKYTTVRLGRGSMQQKKNHTQKYRKLSQSTVTSLREAHI